MREVTNQLQSNTRLYCLPRVIQSMSLSLASLLQSIGLGGSVVERRSLTGELSMVCTGPAADG